MIGMLSVNILINQGGRVGWLSPMVLGLGLLSVITFIVFYKIERNKEDAFIDFNTFNNKTYKGAAISNFLISCTAGTLTVTLSLVQLAADLSPLQAGFLTIGYFIGILIAIKVGEKLLQKWGPCMPMVLSSIPVVSDTYFWLIFRVFLISLISVTHRLLPENLKRYDEIIILKEGEIIEYGSFEQSMNIQSYFKKMFEYTKNQQINTLKEMSTSES